MRSKVIFVYIISAVILCIPVKIKCLCLTCLILPKRVAYNFSPKGTMGLAFTSLERESSIAKVVDAHLKIYKELEANA